MTFLRDEISTAWTSYIPIFNTSNNDGSIGNGTIRGVYRRDGDSIDLVIKMTWGSTTSGGSGTFRWSLPVGLNADPSKIPINEFPGELYGAIFLTDNSTATNNRAGAPEAATSSALSILPDGDTSVTATTPFTWATSDELKITAMVPIVGY